MRLLLKVVPGSSNDAIAGWLGDTLKVRVTAPPEKGKANAAVREIIAQALELPVDAVRIVAGAAASRKIVEVIALSESEVRRRLSSKTQ